jgi:hypothetical protein
MSEQRRKIIAFPSHKKLRECEKYKRSDKDFEANEFLTNGTLTLLTINNGKC